MKGITAPRGGGKTYEIVQAFLNEENALLFVAGHTEKKRIIREYEIPRHKHIKILSWNNPELMNILQVYSKSHKIFIDNVDWFLYSLIGREVNLISYTGEEIPKEIKKELTKNNCSRIIKINKG